MTRLFDRQVVLQIGQPGQEGRSWSELRVDFQVDYKPGKIGTASIEAYNLAPEALAAAQRPGALVRLLAGYDVPRQIFVGSPLRRDGVTLERTGPDTILKLQARDGARRLSTTRVNLSFAEEVALVDAVQEVARALGVPRRALRVDSERRLPAGTVLKGPARKVLHTLLAEESQEWSLVGGALQVLGRKEATAEPAVVFSSRTGNLIGSPRRKNRRTIEITGLLAGELRPGRRFVVESLQDDGSFQRATYRAREVAFNGSRWDNDFYVTATGREVPS